MPRKPFPWVAALLTLMLAALGVSAADFDDQLLQKIRQKRETEAQKLRGDVADALARAGSLASAPDEAARLLRSSLSRLLDDSGLPREERTTLIFQVKERLAALPVPAKEEPPPAVAVEKREYIRGGEGSSGGYYRAPPTEIVSAKPERRGASGGGFGGSGFGRGGFGGGVFGGGGSGGAASFQITPVASADRRFVRVRVSGTAIIPNLNAPLVPVQTVVPTILYGPPGTVIVGQPVRVFQVFLTRPSFTTIGINTTVSVPAGGSVGGVGGFSRAAAARYEFGPPGLSSVPYLSRLTRNVATGTALSSPRVGVSVRVISMEEEERRFLAGEGAR